MKLKKVLSYGIFSFMLIVIVAGCQKGSKEEEAKIKEITKGMVKIPAGEFIMGSNKVDREELQQRFGMKRIPYVNEHPARKVYLDEYYIDKYEVTNKEYKEFVDATGHKPPKGWVNGNYKPGTDRHPVVMVTWFDADAYCKWRGKRLPTEAEWEKAARGTDGREFPWGNKFDQKKANSLGLYGGTSEIGHFKEDVSPFGVYDMGGNAAEWTSDWYKAYPGNNFIDRDYGETLKVVRGGSWGGIGHYSFEFFYRTPFRNPIRPKSRLNDVGIRCVWSKKETKR